MSDARTVFEMGIREYARTPVLLALVVFLPAYFVLLFGRVMPDQPVPVDVVGTGTLRRNMTAVVAVLMTPMATALVGGAAGLFLMQSARTVDRRLAIVGARVEAVLAARAGVLALAAVVATLVSVAALATIHVPESPGWFVLATLVVGVLYGAIGALIGLALNRLAGVYVLLFGPLLDIFLAQSPLSESSHAVAPYLPAHYPMQLVFDAAFTTAVDPTNFWWSLAYLAAVLALAGVVFGYRIRVT
ncbi:MAG: ABC transporter permease [Haloglomus sp.]